MAKKVATAVLLLLVLIALRYRRAVRVATVSFVMVALTVLGFVGFWKVVYEPPRLQMSLLNSHDATTLLLCQTDKVYRG